MFDVVDVVMFVRALSLVMSCVCNVVGVVWLYVYPVVVDDRCCCFVVCFCVW